MAGYEYDIVIWCDDSGWDGLHGFAGLRAMLNAKGTEGWRLVAGDRRDEGDGRATWIILERDILEQRAAPARQRDRVESGRAPRTLRGSARRA
jgi:hypothetical protein